MEEIFQKHSLLCKRFFIQQYISNMGIWLYNQLQNSTIIMGFWSYAWNAISSGVSKIGKGIVQLLTSYNPDEKTENQIKQAVNDLRNEVQNLKKQCKSLEEFKTYKIQAQRHFFTALKKIHFHQSLDRTKGQKYCCVIGNTSAGKSYMLNVLFGTKLETGMGTTTQTADLALSIGNLHIYDAPGLNEEFEFYEPKTLNLFASMDYIFICYAESVLNNKALISSLSIINKHTIVLVRTKCNQGKAYQKSAEETRNSDYKELSLIQENRVKNIYLMGDNMQTFDAQKLRAILH